MRMTEGVAAAAAVHHVAKHFGIDSMDAGAAAAEPTAETTTTETTTAETTTAETTAAEAAAGETAAAIHALPQFIVVIISSTFPDNKISSVSNEWC